MSGASQLLAESDPRLALGFNPFNADARVNAVVADLNGGTAADLQTAEADVRGLLSFAPGDARGYSLLGALRERQGDPAAAEQLYETALGHSKTEIHALLRLADARLRQNDMTAAMRFIDLILRRWPAYWDQILPVFSAAVTTPEGRAALRARLDELPPWRGRAIGQIVKDANGILFARDLLLDAPEAAQVRPEWPGEVDTVVTALAGARAYGEAQLLFLASLTPAQELLSGYVYDPGFTQAASGGYFGWRVPRGGAAEIRLPATRVGGLRLWFQDAPARPGLVTQTLRLPAGAYRLEAEVQGNGLELPRRLFWRVSCPDGRQQLADLEIPQGSYQSRTVAADLNVPAITCPVQRLSLDTEVRTDSWRDRYRGEVQFTTLRIRRL